MSHVPGVPRRARQSTYIRRRIVFGTALLAVLVLIVGLGVALLRPVGSAVAATTTPLLPTVAAQELPWPATGVGAIGAVGYDGVLDSYGAQTSTPIASMTKTITALVVLDKMPMDAGDAGPTYTLTKRDVEIYDETIANDGSSAPVVVGAKLTQREMLEAMLIPSANNYATALAEWSYGSLDDFLVGARTWLDQRGLTDTFLADASGINAGSKSSPANLIEIGKLVIAHPVLSEIVSMAKADLPIGTVKNTNTLLGKHGIIGLKTGTTNIAGACLLFATKTEVDGKEVTVIGVEIGADTHAELFSNVAALAEAAATRFHTATVATAGETFGTISTPWGDAADLVAATDASQVLWQTDTTATDVKVNDKVSGDAGDVVGTVTFTSGSQTTTVDLTLSDRVRAIPGLWWRLTHAFG